MAWCAARWNNALDKLEHMKPVPKLVDVVGDALSHIGPYKQLDNKRQVVALIDDVSIRRKEENLNQTWIVS